MRLSGHSKQLSDADVELRDPPHFFRVLHLSLNAFSSCTGSRTAEKMGQPSKDVESLQEGRRGRRLDVFLLMSVLLLFAAVTALTVGGAIIVTDMRTKLERPRNSSMKNSSSTPNVDLKSSSKIQNYIYLEASPSELNNSTLNWAPAPDSASSSEPRNFVYDSVQHFLMPKQAGNYFTYINLNLSCTYDCNGGVLSVHFGDILTCEVELPAKADSIPVSKRCWTVSAVNGQKLLTQMTVPKEGLNNWKLESTGSGLGMFLVG